MKRIVQIITEESAREAVARSGVFRGLIRYINMRCDLLFGDAGSQELVDDLLRFTI